MPFSAVMLFVLSLVAGVATVHAQTADVSPIRLTIRDEVLNPVDSRLFGQFMERASWGEPGYDAARDADHPRQLRPAVVEKMQWMNIPVIRFPAGADLMRIDWRDMIDNVPGREGGRPPFRGKRARALSNEFGIDEFLGLCEKLGAEGLLPVRLHPAVMQDKPGPYAADAAALVAYCNAPAGADLPEGMTDWPAVRAANGREKPWGVKYFQIGNESWHYFNDALKRNGLAEASIDEKAELYLRSLRAFLEAMHAIDPDIQIIVDGVTGAGPWVDRKVLNDPTVRKHASYFSLHLYQPWGIGEVKRDGERVSVGDLTAKDIWYAWVATPAISRQTGQSRLPYYPDWCLVRDICLPIACTEWNWNGWWSLPEDSPKPPLNSHWARGIGAAGMLHAFMRSGDEVQLACQSLLVGQRWGITAIRVNDEDADGPYFMPTGQVTGLYSRHHGSELLLAEVANMRSYDQPLRFNSIAPARRVAMVDVLVTRGRGTAYVHMINRHADQPMPVQIDVSELVDAAAAATLHEMTGQLEGRQTQIDQRRIAPADGGAGYQLRLSARSVSILSIPLERQQPR